jgi:anthranilate/para-aminobenzoate synthase component I
LPEIQTTFPCATISGAPRNEAVLNALDFA